MPGIVYTNYRQSLVITGGRLLRWKNCERIDTMPDNSVDIRRSNIVALTLGDRRYIELITDALSWAMTHFDELGYNCKTGKQKLQIMPNMVGFQFVLRGICSRLGAPNRKADIVVDQQSQFNTTQRELREFYYQIREMPWVHGPGLPVMDVTNMPAEPLVFQSGTKSAGLELVDIYLWIFKRFMEGKELTRPPYPPGLHQSQYRQDGQCLPSVGG